MMPYIDGIPVIRPYNPLDKFNLGESVAKAAVNSMVHPLPPDPFIGAGVYLLYYSGDNPLYRRLAEVNRDGQFAWPIYVGKAVPPGARKGNPSLSVNPGKALLNRLCDHAGSIEAAENLLLCDFSCRFLVVDDIWIPLAESLLIEKFSPVWNCILDGFGNHDPGSGRLSGKMPYWDCVHPGREWAARLRPCSIPREELEYRVYDYLESQEFTE